MWVTVSVMNAGLKLGVRWCGDRLIGGAMGGSLALGIGKRKSLSLTYWLQGMELGLCRDMRTDGKMLRRRQR